MGNDEYDASTRRGATCSWLFRKGASAGFVGQHLARAGTPQAMITATPNPTPDGVFFITPEILPEADPRNAAFFNRKA